MPVVKSTKPSVVLRVKERDFGRFYVVDFLLDIVEFSLDRAQALLLYEKLNEKGMRKGVGTNVPSFLNTIMAAIIIYHRNPTRNYQTEKFYFCEKYKFEQLKTTESDRN